jgi:hypothetical protein
LKFLTFSFIFFKTKKVIPGGGVHGEKILWLERKKREKHGRWHSPNVVAPLPHRHGGDPL